MCGLNIVSKRWILFFIVLLYITEETYSQSIIVCDAIELHDGMLQIGFDEDELIPMKFNLMGEYPEVTPGEQHSGFDAQIARIIARTLKVAPSRDPVTPHFVPIVTDNFAEDILGPVRFPPIADISISAITATAEREDQYNVKFVNVTNDFPTFIAIPTDEDPEDWFFYEDLCGKSFAVNRGTIYETFHITALNDFCDEAGLPSVTGRPGDSQEATEQLLIDGEVDGYLDVVTRIGDFITRNPNFYDAPVGCPTNTDGADTGGSLNELLFLGIAVSETSTELIDCLERAVLELFESGQLFALFDQWFRPYIELPSDLQCDFNLLLEDSAQNEASSNATGVLTGSSAVPGN